ncbi:MAG: PIN domain-containing protein [Candidatus Diapherotrites archaeon]
MKLVVDTNRIIAALVRDSYSRRIILSEKFEFATVEFGISEVKKHRNYILKKAKLSTEQFNDLMTRFLVRIEVLSEEEISAKAYADAVKIMGAIDKADVPFIALALGIKNDGIWSDDGHFLKQKAVKVWRTKPLADKL